MALNKSVLSKLAEKTKDEPEIRKFLIDVFQIECSHKPGWFSGRYNELLEEYCKEESNK